MAEDPPIFREDGWTLEHLALVSADLGAWSWDIATNRVTWSARVYELFGVAPGAFDGTVEAYSALVHPLDRERLSGAISSALAGALNEWSIEHRVSGFEPERWLSCRGRVMHDEAGRPVRMAGVVQDVTPRRRAEREEREESSLMQAALEASAFAVVVLDPTGKIIFCNTRASTMLGISRSAAEGRTYDAPQFKHSAVDGGPWPDDKQPFVRVMATGEPVRDIEHAVEWPDGKRIMLRISGGPVKDETGTIRLVVFSFEDVTERHAFEHALRQSQKMEAIGRLAGGVAHDFNNLLTIILSFTALIRGEKGLSPLVADGIESITEAGERAAALTRQLLALGRRDPNRPVVFDARERIAQGARLIERAVGAQVTVKVESGSEACVVKMDEQQLHQVLLNLALNARDAMPDGGQLVIATDVVELEASRVVGLAPGRYVRIQLTDEGTGMDEATRVKAMEPFFTTKIAHEGSGLGLATCHGIVHQAGGVLSIESELERGTAITIHLPFVDARAGADAEKPEHPAQPAAGSNRERILVVEDDPAVRLATVRTLRAAGFDVRAAGNGDEAVAMIRAAGVDLVVCDIVLRRQSGFEVVAALREVHPQLPALFVSGYSAELDRLGDAPFLAKPFKPEELRATVRRLLDAK